MYFITGCLGITLSYHRQLSHKAFTTPKWLEYTLAYCGAMAVQAGFTSLTQLGLWGQLLGNLMRFPVGMSCVATLCLKETRVHSETLCCGTWFERCVIIRIPTHVIIHLLTYGVSSALTLSLG